MLEAFRTPSALSPPRAAAMSHDASGSGVAGPGLCAAGSKGLDACQRKSSLFSESADSNRPCSPQCSSRHRNLRNTTDRSAESESAMLFIDGNDVDAPTPTEAVRPRPGADASLKCGSSSFQTTDAAAPALVSKHIQQPFSVSLLLRKGSKTSHLHNASLALSNSRFFTGSHTPSTASNRFLAALEEPKQCFSFLQNQQPSRPLENATYCSAQRAPANSHYSDDAHRGLITPPLLAYRTPEVPMPSDTTTQATTPPQENTPRTPRQSRGPKERHRSATRPRISRRRKGRSARRRSYSDDSYSTDDDDSFPQHHPGGTLPPQESTRLTRSGLRY